MVATDLSRATIARAVPHSCELVGDMWEHSGHLIAIVRHHADGRYGRLTLSPSTVFAGSYNTQLTMAFDHVHPTSSLSPSAQALRLLSAKARRIVQPRHLQTIIWRSLVRQLQSSGSINARAAFDQVVQERELQDEPFGSWELYKLTNYFAAAWHQLVEDILAA